MHRLSVSDARYFGLIFAVDVLLCLLHYYLKESKPKFNVRECCVETGANVGNYYVSLCLFLTR